MPTKICKCCGRTFEPGHANCQYCCDSPAVNRFISPDGRSYVGSARHIRCRANNGIHRSNARLLAAFAQYPPETFIFAILEQLPPGCATWKLRKAEQRHINRLRSWKPEAGFNIMPAVWQGDGPAQRAGREFGRARIACKREAV
jgi:hypothetical protein